MGDRIYKNSLEVKRQSIKRFQGGGYCKGTQNSAIMVVHANGAANPDVSICVGAANPVLLCLL